MSVSQTEDAEQENREVINKLISRVQKEVEDCDDIESIDSIEVNDKGPGRWSVVFEAGIRDAWVTTQCPTDADYGVIADIETYHDDLDSVVAKVTTSLV